MDYANVKNDGKTQTFAIAEATFDLMRLQFGGCLSDNWKPSFLPLLLFNWRTFSRRVTARWSSW